MAMPDVTVLAGMVSTSIFVVSYLPMLVKAARSKDLSSYSGWNLVLANAGNLVHSVYVLSLPAGPLWALHGFYLAASVLMLVWWVRYRRQPSGQAAAPPALAEAEAGSAGPGAEQASADRQIIRAPVVVRSGSARRAGQSASSRTVVSYSSVPTGSFRGPVNCPFEYDTLIVPMSPTPTAMSASRTSTP